MIQAIMPLLLVMHYNTALIKILSFHVQQPLFMQQLASVNILFCCPAQFELTIIAILLQHASY